jgi:hypothetical protein
MTILTNPDQTGLSPAVVITTSVLIGFGAAVLWVALGSFLTNNSSAANYASNVGNIDTNATNTRANAGLTANQAYASAYGAAGNALNNALNPNPVMAYLQSLKGGA